MARRCWGINTINKRGAIGLSMNVLVIVIISIVILAGGITLLYSFIETADTVKQDLDTKTSAELERLLISQGKQVALPFQKATLFREEQHVFGLGILNIDQNNDKFYVVVEPPTIDSNTAFNAQALLQEAVLYDSSQITLKENEHTKVSISVIMPKDAPSGTYAFTVRVLREDSTQYGNAQKMYVELK